MKLVGYKCEKCEHQEEEFFGDTEKPPKKLGKKCEKCGSVMKLWNFKNNPHRWNYLDRGGL